MSVVNLSDNISSLVTLLLWSERIPTLLSSESSPSAKSRAKVLSKSALRPTEEVFGILVSRLCERGVGPKLTYTGFDRDLGVAGRVMVRAKDGSIQQKLVKVDRPSMSSCLLCSSVSNSNATSSSHSHLGHSSGTQGII